jgi:hypothetical protein
LHLDAKIPAGRHIFSVRGQCGDAADESDAFVAVDVEP